MSDIVIRTVVSASPMCRDPGRFAHAAPGARFALRDRPVGKATDEDARDRHRVAAVKDLAASRPFTGGRRTSVRKPETGLVTRVDESQPVNYYKPLKCNF